MAQSEDGALDDSVETTSSPLVMAQGESGRTELDENLTEEASTPPYEDLQSACSRESEEVFGPGVGVVVNGPEDVYEGAVAGEMLASHGSVARCTQVAWK